MHAVQWQACRGMQRASVEQRATAAGRATGGCWLWQLCCESSLAFDVSDLFAGPSVAVQNAEEAATTGPDH